MLDDEDAVDDKKGVCVRTAAFLALGNIGPNAKAAIPVLLKKLKTTGNRTEQWYILSDLARIGGQDKEIRALLIRHLKDKNPLSRVSAARALSLIGPEAGDAMPALLEAYQCKDVEDPQATRSIRSAVCNTWERIGPGAKDAVPVLIAAVKDRSNDYVFRQGLFDALQKIGPEAKEAVPTLIEVLKDPKQSSFYEGADRALAAIGQEAVPALVEALGDAEHIVRKHAAITLGLMGPPAKAAIPALTRALGDEHPLVSSEAEQALKEIRR